MFFAAVIRFYDTQQSDAWLAWRGAVIARWQFQMATELIPYPGDSQKVELLGRNRLIDELLRDNLEVALPVPDRGIDLIAYADLSENVSTYVARPIQMKAAWKQSFAIDRKYEKFPDLLIAYVWNLSSPNDAVTYAMSFSQSCAIAVKMGYTRTSSWERGSYVSNAPGKRLSELLKPFEMKAGAWWRLVVHSNAGARNPHPTTSPCLEHRARVTLESTHCE